MERALRGKNAETSVALAEPQQRKGQATLEAVVLVAAPACLVLLVGLIRRLPASRLL